MSKKIYIQGFLMIVVLLAIVKCVFPGITSNKDIFTQEQVALTDTITEVSDSIVTQTRVNESNISLLTSRFFNAEGCEVKHKIYSVPSYKDAFPDQNDIQLLSAQKYGVPPVTNREEAETRKSELVYVGSNPYFYVETLKQSIPYLVPRASILLQDIGRTFFDSLTIKGIPLHKIIVTSVMRSKDDVTKLRGHNRNATVNSCHLYGTTFDICYNRYQTVEAPDGIQRRKVRNDTLKWVLSEVLNDMRLSKRCHIKYEVHQGCFHITVK